MQGVWRIHTTDTTIITIMIMIMTIPIRTTVHITGHITIRTSILITGPSADILDIDSGSGDS